MVIDWERNVGTNGHPVSYLHERAVALLYDELKPRRNEGNPPRGATFRPPWRAEGRVRLADGTLSHNIREGMATLTFPDEWTNLGGVVPDLIMYGEDGKPIRIIEVIVTSPPSKYKRAQLDTLTKRGVDVVEVVVRNPDDLMTLCWTPTTPRYSATTQYDKFSVNYAQNDYTQGQKRQLDEAVVGLARALIGCSPQARRELYEVLQGLGSFDSLFPVHPLNPKAEVLRERTEG